MKWIHSLRAKLLYIYLGISILSLLLFSIIVYKGLEDSLVNQRKDELIRKANITATHIAKYDFTKSAQSEEFKKDIIQAGNEVKAKVIIIDANGMEIADSTLEKGTTRLYATPEILEALKGGEISGFTKDYKIQVLVPIKNEKQKIIGVVYILDTSEKTGVILREVREKFYIMLLATSIITIIFIIFLSGIIMSPIKEMLKVIEKMTEGRFNQKIKVRGHDELSELSMAFNQMSAKLQKVDASRQEFVANVSHELKTPLSSMKVLIESVLFQDNVSEETYKEFLTDTNSEIDRLTEIINSLLVLVKLDRKVVPINAEMTNMNELLSDIIKRLKPLSDKREIELIYDQEKEVNGEVDVVKITLALTNLIENGIKYNNDGGYVKVKLDGDHQNAYISIEDNGIGIPEEEQNKVFERFYRIDKTRDRDTGGTGLGLAITQRTVLLHNGSIKLTSKENEGTMFLVRVPLKQGK
ncbi:MAG: hypothetical protein A2Y22_04560 [Clostridiales bacterium GWD2_32_59]|nr:MAG: hypothetical protein A2Y22_04560 [Clostridiales bacterium GWD2_32_59]